MADDEFYEDDESPEDVRAAWNAGEPGVTSGPRSLDNRAQATVNLVVVAWGSSAATEQIDVTLTPPR